MVSIEAEIPPHGKSSFLSRKTSFPLYKIGCPEKGVKYPFKPKFNAV